MFTNFMTVELPIIQLAITLGLGLLVYYVKTVVREGNNASERQVAKLQLDLEKQLGEFKVQMASRSAESQQIHHDMERRITTLESFYKDINVQLSYLRQNTSKLLRTSSSHEQQMSD